MRMNDLYPSDFLKAADLQGRPVTIKMGHVEMETIGQDKKPVLHFQGSNKKLVMNKTNANTISALYGDDTDQWQGQPITLVEAMVDYQGKSVPAIRVRAPAQGYQRQQPQRQDPISSGKQTPQNFNQDMNDEIPF